MDNWFALQIDRDFITRTYGDGIRLYLALDLDKYYIIKSGTYKDDVLTISTKCGETFTLKTEPNNKLFSESIYKLWEVYDKKYLCDDENRVDYEPWALNSKKALAIEMKLFTENDVIMYYNKSHLS